MLNISGAAAGECGVPGGPTPWGRGRGGEGWLVSHLQTPLSEVGGQRGLGVQGCGYVLPGPFPPPASGPLSTPRAARPSEPRAACSLFPAIRLPARAWCPREGAAEMCSVPRLPLTGPATGGWTRLTFAFGRASLQPPLRHPRTLIIRVTYISCEQNWKAFVTRAPCGLPPTRGLPGLRPHVRGWQ